MSMENTNLIPVQDWMKNLVGTDHLKQVPVSFDGASEVKFTLPPGWNIGLAGKGDLDLTEAMVTLGGEDYQLTKEAITRIGIEVGITAKYLEKTPGILIQSHLDYWAMHAPEIVFGLLAGGKQGMAVVKKAIPIFSNVNIFQSVIEYVCSSYDVEEDSLYVDFKSSHTLDLTTTRLIFPEPALGFESAATPAEEWCGGVQITNSLTGRHVTGIEGYLFRKYDSSAVVTQHSAAHYNRRTGHDLQDVLDWLPGAVKGVLDSLNYELAAIAGLTAEEIPDVSKVLADVFRTYKVPLKVRHEIMDNMVDAEDPSYYGVVTALTKTANDPDLQPGVVTALMQVAGMLAHDSSHRCSACQQVIV